MAILSGRLGGGGSGTVSDDNDNNENDKSPDGKVNQTGHSASASARPKKDTPRKQ